MFYKNKKIVVTGGSGMIGTHYIKELLNRGALIRIMS
jgi:nucleoside-diphosphate-sugar epimerase